MKTIHLLALGFSFISAGALSAPIKVTASELYAEYAKNEVRANKKFQGKELLLSGTVESIESDLNDDPVVNLRTDSFFGNVSASFKRTEHEKVENLDNDQNVTLLCIGGGEILGFPLVENCKFAK